jgi:hypothetical protein
MGMKQSAAVTRENVTAGARSSSADAIGSAVPPVRRHASTTGRRDAGLGQQIVDGQRSSQSRSTTRARIPYDRANRSRARGNGQDESGDVPERGHTVAVVKVPARRARICDARDVFAEHETMRVECQRLG